MDPLDFTLNQVEEVERVATTELDGARHVIFIAALARSIIIMTTTAAAVIIITIIIVIVVVTAPVCPPRVRFVITVIILIKLPEGAIMIDKGVKSVTVHNILIVMTIAIVVHTSNSIFVGVVRDTTLIICNHRVVVVVVVA